MKQHRDPPSRDDPAPRPDHERPTEIPAALPERATSRIVRMPEVCDRTGLSRTTLWRLVKAGAFPTPRRLSANAIGWLDADLEAWIRNRACCR